MKRKLRKLVRDPSAFTRDMVKNRAEDLRRLIPTPPPGRPCRRYSVVAAVYGVEKYLDEFFASIVRQTIGFERHIELIMVDDGSLDGSAAIIERWRKKWVS